MAISGIGKGYGTSLLLSPAYAVAAIATSNAAVGQRVILICLSVSLNTLWSTYQTAQAWSGKSIRSRQAPANFLRENRPGRRDANVCLLTFAWALPIDVAKLQLI